MNARPIGLEIYRTAIPMRGFEHAAASRSLAEAVVVRLQFEGGLIGWGETLPREYVTGETPESVVENLRAAIWPAWTGEEFQNKPFVQAGKCMNAAACAIELAALWNSFDRKGGLLAADGRTLFAPAKAKIDSRVSGVLGSSDPSRTARQLRLMRWYGLRDFKLKLGFDEATDAENLRLVHKRIGGAVAAGKCTLRVDVNGAWDMDSTPQRVAALRQYGVCVVEQPVYCGASELAELAGKCELPLMADESLLTGADAKTLLAGPKRVWWNIRLSKNGGLVSAMELATLAASRGVPFVIGCMVGESSILSAAQRRLLQLIPRPMFVEGNYGCFLLSGDLTAKSLRFSSGGRLKPLPGPTMGVAVDEKKIKKYGKLVAAMER